MVSPLLLCYLLQGLVSETKQQYEEGEGRGGVGGRENDWIIGIPLFCLELRGLCPQLLIKEKGFSLSAWVVPAGPQVSSCHSEGRNSFFQSFFFGYPFRGLDIAILESDQVMWEGKMQELMATWAVPQVGILPAICLLSYLRSACVCIMILSRFLVIISQREMA